MISLTICQAKAAATVWFFAAVVKLLSKNNSGKKRLIQLRSYCSSSSRHLEAEDCCLLIGFLGLAQLTSYTLICLGTVPPTVGCTFPQPSSMQKMPHRPVRPQLRCPHPRHVRLTTKATYAGSQAQKTMCLSYDFTVM